MEAGKHCPSCSRGIGFWLVFFSNLGSVRCRNCRTRLRFEGSTQIGVVGVVIFVGLFLVLGEAARRIGISSSGSWVAGFGLGWPLTDAILTLYARNARVLVVKDSPSS
jgi:hypothetical protein